MAKFLKTQWFYLFLTVCVWHINVCSSFDFDKEHFGVSFTPYVKQLENGDKSSYKTGYTFENIKTMLTVVSTKFSRILVKDCLSTHDQYLKNYTYYHGSRASVYSGEAAALINKESGTKILTVLYLLCEPKYVNNTETEVHLAFEAAEKANKIFPGTVESIVFWKGEEQTTADLTLKYLQSYQEKASHLGLKLGAEHNCFARLPNDSNPLVTTQREIVLESQLIVCGTFRDQEKIGPEAGFNLTQGDLLFFKRSLEQINPNVEVIGFTVWFNSGSEDVDVVDNLRAYWEMTSLWAARNNYTVYLWEAFDNPWQPHPNFNGHVGWWKLEDSSKINFVEGYKEKISGLQDGHFSVIRSHSKRTPGEHTDKGNQAGNQITSAPRMNSANSVVNLNYGMLILFAATIGFLLTF